MNKIKIIFYKNAKYRYIPVSIWFKGQERDLLTWSAAKVEQEEACVVLC